MHLVRARPACLITFVNASWTIRNADSSTVWASGRASPSTVSSTVHAAGARLLDQLVEVGEARLRRPRRSGPVVVVPQQSQRPVHLGHRLAPEVGDRVGLRGDPRVVDRHPERLGLDDHQADVVGDDVVEILGDPHALLGDRPVGQQLALAVGAVGPVAQGLDVGPSGPDVEAEGDGGGALDGHADRVGDAHGRAEAARRSAAADHGDPAQPGSGPARDGGWRACRGSRGPGRDAAGLLRGGRGGEAGDGQGGERPAPAGEDRGERAEAEQARGLLSPPDARLIAEPSTGPASERTTTGRPPRGRVAQSAGPGPGTSVTRYPRPPGRPGDLDLARLGPPGPAAKAPRPRRRARRSRCRAPWGCSGGAVGDAVSALNGIACRTSPRNPTLESSGEIASSKPRSMAITGPRDPTRAASPTATASRALPAARGSACR